MDRRIIERSKNTPVVSGREWSSARRTRVINFGRDFIVLKAVVKEKFDGVESGRLVSVVRAPNDRRNENFNLSRDAENIISSESYRKVSREDEA